MSRGKTASTQAERLRAATRRRQEQEKQALRQAILNAAAGLFLEQGYERFSLRQVAERIGYSPTTIYLYFRNKDDLLFTVVEEGFVRFGKQLEAAQTNIDDPWEQLLALGRAYITFGIENQVYYQMMFVQRTDFLWQSQQGQSQPRLTAFQILRQTVQRAIDANLVRAGDADTYSDLLWATAHGIVSLAISFPGFDAGRVQRLIETWNRTLSDGLRPV
jgi:AcrR family transcriptional regulator